MYDSSASSLDIVQFEVNVFKNGHVEAFPKGESLFDESSRLFISKKGTVEDHLFGRYRTAEEYKRDIDLANDLTPSSPAVPTPYYERVWRLTVNPEEQDYFIFDEDVVLFEARGFVGFGIGCSCSNGMEWEVREGFGEYDVFHEWLPDLYALVAPIIEKNRDKETVYTDGRTSPRSQYTLNFPTLWRYTTTKMYDWYCGGYEYDTEWELLGQLDLNKLEAIPMEKKDECESRVS